MGIVVKALAIFLSSGNSTVRHVVCLCMHGHIYKLCNPELSLLLCLLCVSSTVHSVSSYLCPRFCREAVSIPCSVD